MKQDTTIQMIEPGLSAYVTLLFHIGTSNLYNSCTMMVQVNNLKQKPALLIHLPSPILSSGSSERKTADNDGRRDTFDGH